MNRPDAIFTDLDGTLLGPDKKVGKQDTAAIRRLKRSEERRVGKECT